MNKWQATGFGALMVGIATYAWTMLKPLVTGGVVMAALVIAAVVLLVCIGGWLLSWGMTQPFKNYVVPPFELFRENTAGMTQFQIDQANARYDRRTRLWRGAIFAVAMVSCVAACFGILAGIGLILLPHLTPQLREAYWTLGCIETAIVSFSSPWMWKVVFEVAIPLMFQGRAIQGKYDGAGNLIGAKDLSQPDAKTQLFQTGKGDANESAPH